MSAFSPDFVAAFRKKQRERNRRISSWALEMLDSLKRNREMERGFVTHRTMCDVRWIDPVWIRMAERQVIAISEIR